MYEHYRFVADKGQHMLRIDKFLSVRIEGISRNRIQQAADADCILVNDQPVRSSYKVKPLDVISIVMDRPRRELEITAEDIPLNIVYEDDDLLVIDKPAGLVVHPAAGHADGTLLNALLHHVPDIINVPRAGIVHRLDKDTTGLMVVAKTLEAHTQLVAQLQARTVSRIYECIVIGVVTSGGTVDAPIGRSSANRQRMAVIEGGKPAVSHYRVLERFRSHTHVRVKLETGRTHQIRVHMTYAGFPLVGDPVYAGRFRIPPAASPTLVQTLKEFPRQALHARFLELKHPTTGKRMKWESPLPEDLVWLLSLLRQDHESFV